MVGRILQDESYIGTLICHKSERNKINKTFRFTEPEEQFRHENFFPPIVSREIWEQAQVLLAERKERNVRAGANQSILRYGGLLRCEDCGRSFVGKRIYTKSGSGWSIPVTPITDMGRNTAPPTRWMSVSWMSSSPRNSCRPRQCMRKTSRLWSI